MKGVFIDVETGGLDAKVHALTQVGAIAFEINVGQEPVILETFSQLVSPSQWLAVSPGALDLQHRTLGELRKSGADESDVYIALIGFLCKHIGESAQWPGMIWAQDAAFDHSFCRALEKRAKLNDLFGDRCDWNCTKRLWTLLRGLGAHNETRTSLKHIIAYYGIRGEDEQTHDAADDAMVSVIALSHMINDLAQVFKGRTE